MIAETLPNILAYMSAARQNKVKYYNAFAIMGLGISYYSPSNLTRLSAGKEHKLNKSVREL